ncbi:MAG: Hsp20/alpha crystallin family protein [Phycisphaerales bacterium]|nr:Hsp20/alpha crystallin family protein [Phycisphaerales bacterium]
MNILPWKKRSHDVTPARSVARFRDEIDRVFERFFSDPWDIAWPTSPSFKWSPALDVVDSENEVTVRAELPGIDAKDVDVSISGNVLTICGEKLESTEQKNEDRFVSERHFGAFRRSIELPTGLDPEKIDAEMQNGVLVVKVAKLKAAERKRVPVKGGTTREAVATGSR